jgi:hypothetical protein
MHLEEPCVLEESPARYITVFARSFLVLPDLEAVRMQIWSRRSYSMDIEARPSDHNAGNR